jgi:hypothetical protein
MVRRGIFRSFLCVFQLLRVPFWRPLSDDHNCEVVPEIRHDNYTIEMGFRIIDN